MKKYNKIPFKNNEEDVIVEIDMVSDDNGIVCTIDDEDEDDLDQPISDLAKIRNVDSDIYRFKTHFRKVNDDSSSDNVSTPDDINESTKTRIMYFECKL